MKRVIALFLAALITLTGCTQQTVQNPTPETSTPTESPNSSEPTSESEQTPAQDISVFAEDVEPNFAALSDPSLLQYVEDNIYSDLVAWFDSEDYIVESVNAVYVSEEYLEEVAYNSKSNVYFGYTLEELDAQFEGTRYIFSLGENGETVVEEFAEYDDTYDRVIKNVAIGTGGYPCLRHSFRGVRRCRCSCGCKHDFRVCRKDRYGLCTFLRHNQRSCRRHNHWHSNRRF